MSSVDVGWVRVLALGQAECIWDDEEASILAIALTTLVSGFTALTSDDVSLRPAAPAVPVGALTRR